MTQEDKNSIERIRQEERERAARRAHDFAEKFRKTHGRRSVGYLNVLEVAEALALDASDAAIRQDQPATATPKTRGDRGCYCGNDPTCEGCFPEPATATPRLSPQGGAAGGGVRAAVHLRHRL